MLRAFLIILSFLLIDVTGGSATAAENGKTWQFSSKKAIGIAGAWASAADGKSRLDISCNTRLGKTVAGSFNDYTGPALSRIDGDDESVTFEIINANQKVASFPGKFAYYAPDKGWGYSNYPIALLDAFEHGDKLTLRNSKGTIVAEYDLKGAAQARALMRDVCGF